MNMTEIKAYYRSKFGIDLPGNCGTRQDLEPKHVFCRKCKLLKLMKKVKNSPEWGNLLSKTKS